MKLYRKHITKIRNNVEEITKENKRSVKDIYETKRSVNDIYETKRKSSYKSIAYMNKEIEE